jgi:hypothetical protein
MAKNPARANRLDKEVPLPAATSIGGKREALLRGRRTARSKAEVNKLRNEMQGLSHQGGPAKKIQSALAQVVQKFGKDEYRRVTRKFDQAAYNNLNPEISVITNKGPSIKPDR